MPPYNGYSVAKWDGNTFVVTTVGFDDRAWVDHYGYPMSVKHSDTKNFGLVPKENLTVAGWSGILEDRCLPTDESAFNRVRDAAVGKK